ncbi:hypothetical protein OROHE_000016 [Orobanche hederae]
MSRTNVIIHLNAIDDRTQIKIVSMRILRSWIQKDLSGKEGLEMIIIDEWRQIQASISVGLKRKFLPLLKEGHIILIKKFQVYEKIITGVDSDKGGLFFVCGHGGTGKTYIWRTLCAALRGRGDIIIPVASSGIASLLPPKGRTTHSRFGIPLECHEKSSCSKITLNSNLTGLLKKAKVIIWDEASMTHRYCFEALNRSVVNVMRMPDGSCSSSVFGGLVVVLGGDFRQILPVVPKGSLHDIVHASIRSSQLWDSCEIGAVVESEDGAVWRIQGINLGEFAEWIFNVGDGIAGDALGDGEAAVTLSNDILIRDTIDPIEAIVENIYPDVLQTTSNPEIFKDRAILAPTNEIVDTINDYVMSLMPTKEMVYLS